MHMSMMIFRYILDSISFNQNLDKITLLLILDTYFICFLYALPSKINSDASEDIFLYRWSLFGHF